MTTGGINIARATWLWSRKKMYVLKKKKKAGSESWEPRNQKHTHSDGFQRPNTHLNATWRGFREIHPLFCLLDGMQEPYKTSCLEGRERASLCHPVSARWEDSWRTPFGLSLGAVILSYGKKHSMLILHGAQVTANLLSNLQPGFLLVCVLFFSLGRATHRLGCGWLMSGLNTQRWNRN